MVLNHNMSRVLAASLPPHLRTTQGFDAWFEPLKRRVQIAAQEVYDAVKEIVDDEIERIREEEKCGRAVYELHKGNETLTKSSRSIHSKIGRQLIGSKRTGSHVLSERQVRNLILGFPDLGRFRVVCALSSDVDRALLALLGVKRKMLADRYRVVGTVRDYVGDLSLRSPSRGHRARQFVVEVPTDHGAEVVRVEVQLMTTVQHAWDQRNHPMYEWTREGMTLPDNLVIRDVALAETLYLVDEQASRNWQDVLSHRKGTH